jgi:hypothetical protein
MARTKLTKPNKPKVGQGRVPLAPAVYPVRDLPVPNSKVVSKVLKRATEVIGDQESSMRWMGTPIQALNYATPISLLHNSDGEAAVLRVLGQLEHGVL